MNKICAKFALTIALALIPSFASSATFCVQEFEVLGKTAGDRGLLFVIEHISGECEGTRVHTFFLAGNSQVHTSGNIRYRKTEYITDIVADFALEPLLQGTPDGDAFIIDDSIIVRPPIEDTTVSARFHALVTLGRRELHAWGLEYKDDNFDSPIIEGVEATYIYRSNGGFYKNYKIRQVVLFENSNYLVIITDQPLRATGGDSLHGLLIYRLIPEKP